MDHNPGVPQPASRSNRLSVRAVLFDAVGTLIYPDPPVLSVYYAAGQRAGSRLTTEELAARFAAAIDKHFAGELSSEELERQRWTRIVADVFVDLQDTGTLFEQLWDHFANTAHWAVYDDVADAWRALERRGVIVAIASNFDERLLSIRAALPPLDRNHAIFVSSQLGYLKPHTSFFRAIEEQLACRPDEVLLVGDDPQRDYAGARHAGWQALLLDRKQRPDIPEAMTRLDQVLSYLG